MMDKDIMFSSALSAADQIVSLNDQDGDDGSDPRSESSLDSHRDRAGDDDDRYFAKQESAQVQGLRALALKILFVVAISVSIGVYHVTAKGQQDEFLTS